MLSKQEALREHLYKFNLENQSRVKNFTSLHFKQKRCQKAPFIICHAENRVGSKEGLKVKEPKIMGTKGK